MANINVRNLAKCDNGVQGVPKKALKAYVNWARRQKQRTNYYVDQITYAANFIRKKLESGMELAKIVMEKINRKMKIRHLIPTAGMIALLSTATPKCTIEGDTYIVGPENPVETNPVDTARTPADTIKAPTDTIPTTQNGPTFANPQRVQMLYNGNYVGNDIYWFNEGNALCEYRTMSNDGSLPREIFFSYGGQAYNDFRTPQIYCKDKTDGTIFKRGKPERRFWDPEPGTEHPIIRNAGPDTTFVRPDQLCNCTHDCELTNGIDKLHYVDDCSKDPRIANGIRNVDYLMDGEHLNYALDIYGNQIFKPPGKDCMPICPITTVDVSSAPIGVRCDHIIPNFEIQR